MRSGGTYTFEFNDGCKRVTTTTTLPPYQQPTFEVAYGVICPPNTVATLQAVGITGTVVQPYQFEIIATNTTGGITRPASTDSTFTNLSAGQYNVRGFDGCNNSFTFLGKIGPIPTPKIQFDANPACEGTEVKVRPDVFVFGATYTVTRNDTVIYEGPRGINILPAIAGAYKIKIAVPGGCNATSPPVTLNITGRLAITNPLAACAGTTVNLTAAAITAGSTSGTLAYFQDEEATVALDGTTGPANAIKKAGDYYIRLTTTNPACVTIKKVTVTFKETPAAPTATPTQPTCTTATGTITVTAPTTGVTYSFNNGTNYQAGNVSAALNAGTYQVRVKGTNDCVSAATAVTLNAQPATPVKPTVNVIQPTCTTPTGILSVTAPGSGVTYSFDNGVTYQASSTSNPLATGTYQVKVKNAAGCESVATAATINAQPPTPATPTVSVTQPTCATATGTITVTAPAPAAGIEYSFDNGTTYQASNVSGSLTAGTYQVSARNSFGCVSAAAPAVLSAQPPTPVAPAATVTQPTCEVATGVITVNSPPTATEYSFDNGASYQASNVSGSLAAGVYQVRVKNAQGCISAPAPITINAQPPTPAAPTAAVSQPTCTIATGIISVTPPGSDAEYSFDNGATFQNSSTSNPLPTGTYSIRVKNTFGCISEATQVEINAQPPTPATPVATVTQPTCTVATGTITVTAPPTATEYSFDNGATYQASNVSGSLATGTYQVKVRNVSGCISAATSVTLNAQPPTPVAPAATVTQPTCEVAMGTITVNSPPSATEFSFDNGATYQASNVSPSLATGTYQVRVKNAQGCVSTAAPITINAQPPTPAAPTAAVSQPTCTIATGIISVTPPGSDAEYSFDNGATFQNSSTSNPLPAGTYSIRVKNFFGCISEATLVEINAQPPTPATPVATVTQPTCTVATGTITVTAPSTATEYSFDNGATYQAANVSGSLPAGDYFVKVKNTQGCISDSVKVTLNAQPPTPAAPTARIIQPTCTVATGIIVVTAPSAATEYSFDNGATFQNSSSSNPLAAGTYFIRVKNGEGCISDSTEVVINTQPPTPAAPTATVAQPTCEVATGTITINTPLTATQFSFDNGATFQNSKVSSALPAGDYLIKVKNEVGCISDSTEVTIDPQPATPAAPTATVVQPTCLVATGTVTVTAPSSATSYSFDNGVTYQASNVSPALVAGTYSIKVRNADGCVSDSTAVTIDAQPATPAVPTAQAIQPTCEEATGIISITAPPSATEFSFDNGATFQNSSSSNPLAAGTYLVKVKNSVGCISDSTSVVIAPQPATPAAPTAAVVQPTCLVATGKITVTSTANIINYSFDNGATYQADSVSPALVAGTYSIRVQNDDGCFSDSTVVTIDPQPATPTLVATEKTCADNLLTYTITFISDGQVTASLGTVNNVAKTVSGVPADASVTLTASANGCQRVVVVTAPDCSCPSIAPPGVEVPTITICEGQTIPTFTATVGDGQKAIWYDAPAGGGVLLDSSLTYTPTAAGVFYVEAADVVSDCRSISRTRVELIINPQPVLTIGEVTCRQSGLFYDVAYTATPGAVVSANNGFVTDTSIRRVPAGEVVKIMVTLNGCQDSTTVTQICALPYGSLGDFVWQDTNANGQQDSGEPGIANALVYLLDDQGAVLDSIRTDVTGKYGFDSLTTGKYQVRFFLPEDYDGFTKIRVPGSDTLDSDADATGLSRLIDIDTSQDSTSVLRNNPTIDAGVTRLGSIGDFVFEDKNNDGIQTPGEPGIAGVTVYLLDGSGTLIDSTLTNAGGKYLFDGLLAGTYQVQFVAPAGYDGFTQPNQGNDPAKDSNAGTNGKSQLITIDVSKPKTDTLRNNPQIGAGLISPCLQPIISSTQATAATCDGKTANADARFTLRGLSNGDRFTFATTAANLLPYATATALDADSIQVSGLTNPGSTAGQTYFVRIYNTRQGCFRDTTVLVPFRDCGTVCVQPQAGPDVFVCKPATTTDLPDALSYEEWVVSPSNLATATIDPVTGVVSGLNESGKYAFILRDKTLGSTCADTVVVFRGVLDLPNQTSCEDTLTLPAVAGATYSLVQGNTASITPEGKVSGLTTVGTIYKFVITNGPCTDTIQVERLRCTLIYDLALDKAIDKKLAMLGDTLTYTIKVSNQGEGVVHGIEVTDSLHAGVQYLGSVAETGSYSFATRKWSFDSLAVGDTATLSISVRVIAQGPWFNTAEITKMTEKDEDSTPGNDQDGEDDIDRECFTVPALICRGQGLSAVFTVPAQYTGVEWFRTVTGGSSGGDAVKVGEGNTFTAEETELGSYEYTFTTTNGTCPATGCCPAIVVVQDCCPADVCVPFVITKKVK